MPARMHRHTLETTLANQPYVSARRFVIHLLPNGSVSTGMGKDELGGSGARRGKATAIVARRILARISLLHPTQLTANTKARGSLEPSRLAGLFLYGLTVDEGFW